MILNKSSVTKSKQEPLFDHLKHFDSKSFEKLDCLKKTKKGVKPYEVDGGVINR